MREAIEESNAIASGNKYIDFAASMAGETIFPINVGYVISGTHIIIDGSGIYGDILIDAKNLGASQNLFDLFGDYNTLYDLRLHGWPEKLYPGPEYGHAVRVYDYFATGYASYNTLDLLVIYGFERDGILIDGSGGYSNTISNSLIGAEYWDSTSCSDGNGENGIEIANGAGNNTINNNRIVCNANSGIGLNGSESFQIDHTNIQSNFIGSDGSADMGNAWAGIADSHTRYTSINGNLISGNNHEGIWLNDTYNATIVANKIGVDQNSTTALPNAYSGVVLTTDTTLVNIGDSTDSNLRNIISGNSSCGVEFNGGAHHNALSGNYIGWVELAA